MSDKTNPDLERRLAALNENTPRQGATKRRRSPLLAFLMLGLILAGGAVLYFFSRPEGEVALPTATPDEFQAEGDGFGEIDPFVPPPAPDPEIVLVAPEPAEPNAELLAQIEALQMQIEELRTAPEPAVEADTAAAEAIDALTARIAALQAASEVAQQQFQDELAARDRALQALRTDLDLARLEAGKPVSALPSPTEDELRALEADRLRKEEEARRLSELQRRAEEERAFQARRIASPVMAFGGTDAGETALSERRFGEVTEFVLNGALPSAVTQAEVIANPSNTVVQGTMIQAVMETALDSSLPGQTRAIVSEDVFSYDGTRLLIPRGSRLIGRYRSGIRIAERRVTIAWDRIILPNDQTIRISAFGGDALGRSGVTGFVDTRFAERFGSAALISIISAAPGATAAKVENETTAVVLEDVGDDLADATDGVISEYLSIGPVIHVDQGARVTVMVDRDLEIF
jgi:type IV secretion system protein VirB10